MNRPIEFRAWDKQHNEWLGADAWFVRSDNSVLVVWPEVAKGMDISVHMETLDTSRVALSQFTGLLDRNGSKIFEGDIVKGYAAMATIEWDVDQWVTNPIAAGRFSLRLSEDNPSDGLEVVGNCYEHPELLEQGS